MKSDLKDPTNLKQLLCGICVNVMFDFTNHLTSLNINSLIIVSDMIFLIQTLGEHYIE